MLLLETQALATIVRHNFPTKYFYLPAIWVHYPDLWGPLCCYSRNTQETSLQVLSPRFQRGQPSLIYVSKCPGPCSLQVWDSVTLHSCQEEAGLTDGLQPTLPSAQDQVICSTVPWGCQGKWPASCCQRPQSHEHLVCLFCNGGGDYIHFIPAHLMPFCAKGHKGIRICAKCGINTLP